MKILLAGAVAASVMGATLVFAASSTEQIGSSIRAATEYGITHFTEIEFERNRVEIEGWMDEEWFVELEISAGGDIEQKERERRIDGPWGMSAEDVMAYAEAAFAAGVTQMEGIEIRPRGVIEVDGEDERGRDIDVYFEVGSTEPVNVERDD